jgi:hypothetical protein
MEALQLAQMLADLNDLQAALSLHPPFLACHIDARKRKKENNYIAFRLGWERTGR